MKRLMLSWGSTVRNFPVCSFPHNTSKFSRFVLLSCLVIIGTSSSSFSSFHNQRGILHANWQRQSVPFKGKLLAQSNGQRVVGTGEGTHIGKFDFLAEGDENTNIGIDILTAANGDQVFADHAVTNMEFVGNNTVKLTLDNTITGGTGRFAGASGSFIIIAYLNLMTGTSPATFDGTISY